MCRHANSLWKFSAQRAVTLYYVKKWYQKSLTTCTSSYRGEKQCKISNCVIEELWTQDLGRKNAQMCATYKRMSSNDISLALPHPPPTSWNTIHANTKPGNSLWQEDCSSLFSVNRETGVLHVSEFSNTGLHCARVSQTSENICPLVHETFSHKKASHCRRQGPHQHNMPPPLRWGGVQSYCSFAWAKVAHMLLG